MNLEQRVEALELAIENMTAQQQNADELKKMMQDTASELIKNACRTGGAINAAQKQTAYYKVGNGYVHITPTKIISLL